MPDLDFNKAVGLMEKVQPRRHRAKSNNSLSRLHGKDDGIIPPEDAQIIYGKLSTKTKMLKIFDNEESGAVRCQDDRQAGVKYMADWLKGFVFNNRKTSPKRNSPVRPGA